MILRKYACGEQVRWSRYANGPRNGRILSSLLWLEGKLYTRYTRRCLINCCPTRKYSNHVMTICTDLSILLPQVMVETRNIDTKDIGFPMMPIRPKNSSLYIFRTPCCFGSETSPNLITSTSRWKEWVIVRLLTASHTTYQKEILHYQKVHLCCKRCLPQDTSCRNVSMPLGPLS